MKKRNDLRVALHEAGHAVMHTFLRLDNLDAVSIEPRGTSGGRIEVRYSLFIQLAGTMTAGDPQLNELVRHDARLKLRNHIFVTLAGGEAELLTPRVKRPRDKSDFDNHLVPIFDALFSTQKDWERISYLEELFRLRVRRLVRGILRQPIKEFAETLLQRREIEG